MGFLQNCMQQRGNLLSSIQVMFFAWYIFNFDIIKCDVLCIFGLSDIFQIWNRLQYCNNFLHLLTSILLLIRQCLMNYYQAYLTKLGGQWHWLYSVQELLSSCLLFFHCICYQRNKSRGQIIMFLKLLKPPRRYYFLQAS